MTYPINYPTPQDCDVQIFYGTPQLNAALGPGNIQNFGWVKPKGTSFVWFTLIGGGGYGGESGDTSGGGGGSGAVTNCLMPAFLVPDELRVSLGGGTASAPDTRILYQGPQASAGYLLLRAGGGNYGTDGSAGTGGEAVARSAFAAAGLYQSIAGQAGQNGTNISPSATTFLSGGTNDGASVTPNYGYPTSTGVGTTGVFGFFQMSPIIVGRGGAGGSGGAFPTGTGGVGCGGGGASTGVGGAGGAGMVAIISW